MAMTSLGRRWYYRDGERYELQSPQHIYRCPSPLRFPEEPHPRPCSRGGNRLDWEVWRHVVDRGIKRPDLIREQVQARQAELQAQGDSVESEIAHAYRRLTEVDNERAFCLRKAKQGKITEAEFDAAMEETEDTRQYWQSELARLQELRDDAVKVETSLDCATELLTTLQIQLPEIDIPPDELKALPEGKRNKVLERRREIIRTIVDKVEVWANGQVKVHGLLDGSEAAQFELASSRTR